MPVEEAVVPSVVGSPNCSCRWRPLSAGGTRQLGHITACTTASFTHIQVQFISQNVQLGSTFYTLTADYSSGNHSTIKFSGSVVLIHYKKQTDKCHHTYNDPNESQAAPCCLLADVILYYHWFRYLLLCNDQDKLCCHSCGFISSCSGKTSV